LKTKDLRPALFPNGIVPFAELQRKLSLIFVINNL